MESTFSISFKIFGTKKRKLLVYFNHQNVNSLCSLIIRLTGCASGVFTLEYRKTILNQKVYTFFGLFCYNTIFLNMKTRSFPLLKAKYNHTQEQNTISCLSYLLEEGLMEGVLQVLVVEAPLTGPQLEMSQNKVPQE